MFDGVPEQFHQFIASSTRTSPQSLSLPLPFPLHGTSNNSFPGSFDLYTSSSPHHHHHHHQIQLQLQQSPPPPPIQSHGFLHPNFLHHHQQSHHAHKLIDGDDGAREENSGGLVSMSLNVHHGERLEQRQQQQRGHGNFGDDVDDCQWTSDEVVALLRVRSDMENWFQDVTWEHVSRKLEDLGYKKSAQNCKTKFEEESRLINGNNNNDITYAKNRILSELEEIYHGNPQHNTQLASVGKNKEHAIEKPREEEEEEEKQHEQQQEEEHRESLDDKVDQHLVEETSVKEHPLQELKSKESDKKRKREERLKSFKGFCEKIVNQLMTQQEEMHNKFIEDMERRDKEMVEREEAWKKQEMDRFTEELDLRTQEEAIARKRQAAIIEFLKKFASSIDSNNVSGSNSSTSNVGESQKVTLPYTSNPPTQTSLTSLHVLSHQVSHDSHSPLQENRDGVPVLVPTPVGQQGNNSSGASILDKNMSSKNPSSVPTHQDASKNQSVSTTSNNTPKDDIGKRWPKDEVQALINLRCSIDANNDDREAAKAPLWERISQGMMVLGYQRSAKRCKEKWENINKYYRKTKDINKKRSLDSRTCPYFHQLSNLYNQKKITSMAAHENKQSDIPENRTSLPETGPNLALKQVEEDGHEGEKNITQPSSAPFGIEI